jgi:diguanylate cyclase
MKMMRRPFKPISFLGVFARVVMLALIVSMIAGGAFQILSHNSIAGRSMEMAIAAYLMGALGGFVIAIPLVHAFIYSKLKRENTLDVDQILREDTLTGLLTRQEFFLQISRQGSGNSAQSYFFAGGVLLLIDVDELSRINDIYGHSAGDDALVAISGALKKSVRDIDFISRLGGEEFGVFLPSISQSRGLDIAERIKACVNETPLFANGVRLDLRVSIGATLVGRNTVVPSSIKDADVALAEAKENGKNCVVFGDFISVGPVIESLKQAA